MACCPQYEVMTSPTRGRFVVAKRKLAAGSHVLSDEAIVHPVLFRDGEDSHCPLCFMMTSGPQHCSAVCRSRDPYYELETRARSTGADATPTIVLASRILRAGVQKVSEFVGNLELHTQEERDRFMAMASLTRRFTIVCGWDEEINQNTSDDDIVEVLAKISQNAFTIHDSELQPLGIGMYYRAAMFNHSCKPTIISSFRRKQGGPPLLAIRTACEVIGNQELTNSYIETATPRKRRQDELLSSYKFNCTCERCTTDEDEEDDARCERILQTENAVQKKLDEQNFSEATEIMIKRIHDYENCYHVNSPNLAIARYKLCKLLMHQDDPSKFQYALHLRKIAADALLVAFGSDDPLYREVSETML